jgi:hypothetical protein
VTVLEKKRQRTLGVKRLVFPFITYLFLLKDFLRNENNHFVRFCFYNKL